MLQNVCHVNGSIQTADIWEKDIPLPLVMILY